VLDVFFLAHIGGYSDNTAAARLRQLVGNLREPRAVACGDGHTDALRCKLQGDRPSDAEAAAGDEGRATLDSIIHIESLGLRSCEAE
jgi:hypothetical protein